MIVGGLKVVCLCWNSEYYRRVSGYYRRSSRSSIRSVDLISRAVGLVGRADPCEVGYLFLIHRFIWWIQMF